MWGTRAKQPLILHAAICLTGSSWILSASLLCGHKVFSLFQSFFFFLDLTTKNQRLQYTEDHYDPAGQQWMIETNRGVAAWGKTREQISTETRNPAEKPNSGAQSSLTQLYPFLVNTILQLPSQTVWVKCNPLPRPASICWHSPKLLPSALNPHGTQLQFLVTVCLLLTSDIGVLTIIRILWYLRKIKFIIILLTIILMSANAGSLLIKNSRKLTFKILIITLKYPTYAGF